MNYVTVAVKIEAGSSITDNDYEVFVIGFTGELHISHESNDIANIVDCVNDKVNSFLSVSPVDREIVMLLKQNDDGLYDCFDYEVEYQ